MKRKHAFPLILLVVPLIYTALTWTQIAAVVPLHYNWKGEPDRMGSKEDLLKVIIGLTVLNAILYLLLSNIKRIKTNLTPIPNGEHLRKMGVGICAFIALVQVWIAYSAQTATLFSIKLLLICTALLFCFIGNYMHSLKPNYLAGFRLPWTLRNPENWRLTHQFAAQLWFWAGLLSAILYLFLPQPAIVVVFFLTVVIIVISPIIYSYRLHKKSNA